MMVIGVFSFNIFLLFHMFLTLYWFCLQLSPKGDNNSPAEAEAEEKEMHSTKEDEEPSEKNSKEVCESFYCVPKNTLILHQLIEKFYVLGSYSYC